MVVRPVWRVLGPSRKWNGVWGKTPDEVTAVEKEKSKGRDHIDSHELIVFVRYFSLKRNSNSLDNETFRPLSNITAALPRPPNSSVVPCARITLAQNSRELGLGKGRSIAHCTSRILPRERAISLNGQVHPSLSHPSRLALSLIIPHHTARAQHQFCSVLVLI